MKWSRTIVSVLCSFSSLLSGTLSFRTTPSIYNHRISRPNNLPPLFGATPGTGANLLNSKLLEEFSTYSGEILNPYAVLKVDRNSDLQEIKRAYRALSRRYHPDGVRHRELLPGACSNLDDVRDQWERIKLSYEILKDRKIRAKYDRHEALADPGAALGRAALNAVGNGILGMGKGLFSVGAFAFKTMGYMNEQDASNEVTFMNK